MGLGAGVVRPWSAVDGPHEVVADVRVFGDIAGEFSVHGGEDFFVGLGRDRLDGGPWSEHERVQAGFAFIVEEFIRFGLHFGQGGRDGEAIGSGGRVAAPRARRPTQEENRKKSGGNLATSAVTHAH